MKNWVTKKLGEVYDVRDGTHDSPKYVKEGYALITSKNLKNDNLNYDNVNYITEVDYLNINKRSKVDVGDVLFAMIGTIGNPIVIKNEPDFAIKNVALFKVPKNQDSYFLKYYLDSGFVIEQMTKDAKGATQKFVGLGYLRNFEILLPPLPEQQRIVAILDTAFAAIAKAKANAEQNLKNAKELFENYLQGVFENKGEGWEEKKVNEIGIAQTGTTPKTADKENYGDFIPFIKPADVDFSGIGDIRYGNEGLSEIGLKKGRKMERGSTLMVCIGATIGKVGFAEQVVSCNQQINSLTVKKEFEPKFIYYAMTSKAFQEKVLLEGKGAQATLPIINKSKWENLTISFPKSKTEQKTFVEKFDALQNETKKLETIYQQKINDLEELKKSILQKAFSGELETEKTHHK